MRVKRDAASALPSAAARPLLAAALAAACGADRPASVLAGLPTAEVTLDLRIDGYEADLVPVTWMGVSSTGVIALIQRQDHAVRLFDAAGAPLGSVGREGEGPGEFRFPVRGGWVGDTLWVGDPNLDRVTLISPDAEFIRTLPMTADLRAKPGAEHRYPEFLSASAYAVYPGDSLLAWAFPSSVGSLADTFDGPPLLRTSVDGEIDRVVVDPPNLDDDELAIRVDLEGGGVALWMIPFYPDPQWIVSPRGDRIATLTIPVAEPDAATIRVTVVDANGGEIFDRVYPVEPVPIPGEVVDSAVAAAAERARRPELRRAILSDMRDRVPPVYPPATDILVGSDHRVWVELWPTAEGNPWLVLTPDGAPAMRVVLPRNVELRVAGETHIWALERDTFDVESVVRYQVEGA